MRRRCPALVGIEMHFHDRHGGQGADVMRIEDAEQSLSDFGKLVIDFEMYACGEERKGFKEPLYVRIVAFVRFEDQARGDFRVFCSEFGAELAEVVEFALVVEKELVTH